MAIKQEILKHNDSEIVIMNLPRLFDSDDLAQRLNIGAQRAYANKSTFKAVLDFDYTLRHISSLAFLYGQLDQPLISFPRSDEQYRIAIVVDDVASDFIEGNLNRIFDGPVQSPGDFFERAFRTLMVIGDTSLTYEGYKELQSFQDPWITIHPSREDAIQWCIDNAPWS